MTGMVPPTRPRWTATALLPVPLAALGPLVYVAPLGAVPEMLVLCITAACAAWRARDMARATILRDLAVFAPLLGWMLVSSLWSLNADAALSLGLRLTAVFAAGIALVRWVRVLPLAQLGPCLAATALGFTAASVMILVDLRLFQGVIARHLHAPHGARYDVALFYGRGATIQSIVLVPLLLGLWRSGARRLAILQAALGVLAVLATSSLSAKLALAAAVLAGAVVLLVPLMRFAVPALLALGAAALPFILPFSPDPLTVCWLSNHKASALHRLYIWNFAAERIADRPIAGWGLDAARRVPGGDFPLVIRGCDAEQRPTRQLWVDSTLMPLHPHNAILQVWLELGGVGAILGFGAVLRVLARAFYLPRWRSRGAQAGFTGACCGGLAVALVSFGIWQEWFLAALFIAAAISVLAARQHEALPPISSAPDS
jgi:exopolysaccharide production protein ExoQ